MIAAQSVVPPNMEMKRMLAPCKREWDNTARAYGNHRSLTVGSEHTALKPTTLSGNKRGPLETLEGQPEKRLKMDRTMTRHCAAILKALMMHKWSWAFLCPVNPVKLKIPDYFTVIKKPMDLGTIKSNLDKFAYNCINEFAADVRLTFANAILYNPPTNDFHMMAQKLNDIFEEKWRSMVGKPNRERSSAGNAVISTENTEENCELRKHFGQMPTLHDATINRRPELSEEKAIKSSFVGNKKVTSEQRQSCPRTQHVGGNALINKMQKPSEEEVKKSTSVTRFMPEKRVVEPAEKHEHRPAPPDFHKGINNGASRHPKDLAAAKPISSSVACKCNKCGRSACQCSHSNSSTHASSDLSSEKSSGRYPPVCTSSAPELTKNKIATQKVKVESDSDGECMHPSSQLTTATAIHVTSGPELFDGQMSPEKALRAAKLKQRFAGIILKSQKETFGHGDKIDPVNMQQEKERLERIQLEEKAKIEAQIRAAEAASRMWEEIEAKKQRQREREAARATLDKMVNTVQLTQNVGLLKELEMLCGHRTSYALYFSSKGYVLERLGLIIREENTEWDDAEEGEIIC